MAILNSVKEYFEELRLELPSEVQDYLIEVEGDFPNIENFMVYLQDEANEVRDLKINQRSRFDSDLGRAELAYYQTYTYMGEIKYGFSEFAEFRENGIDDIITNIHSRETTEFDENEYALFVIVKVNHIIGKDGINELIKQHTGHLYVPERVIE